MPTMLSGAIAIDSQTADWIQGPSASSKQVLSAKLPQVVSGSVIDVRATGSARGRFYYKVVETSGRAKDLADSTRVLQVSDGGWHTIDSSTLFEVSATGALSFTVQIDGFDLPGDHLIYHLTLVAKIL